MPERTHDSVAKIEQKALRLSGLLREIDNNFVDLDPGTRDHVDSVLRLVGVRIQATRALLHQDDGVVIRPTG